MTQQITVQPGNSGAGTISRQGSFVSKETSFVISRGNSFLGNGGGLQKDSTIAESIKILSVQSPIEESSGYRKDLTKYSTRDKPGREFSSKTWKQGENDWRPFSRGIKY